ncbi:hypothetical protein AMS68_000161 [Peltaster fructicola]|uniref:Protection of telomeres protein 1 n=1 Tax=Peltaster fructicola TaxID=286661 RepID=A0A6H0XIV6_9PEZI|nr:hypothetical protein AMS68_000161 [Peltaster fructicola]
MAQLPPGFTTLSTLTTEPLKTPGINVIAMVCDKMEPTTTRKGDITMKFKLVDPSTQDTVSGGNGFAARFFYSQTMADTPKIAQLGDIIMLRGVKLGVYDGNRVLMNNKGNTQWSVFPIAGMPKGEYAVTYMGGKQELPSMRSRTTTTTSISLVEKKYILDLASRFDTLSHAFTRGAGSRVQPAHDPLAVRVSAVRGHDLDVIRVPAVRCHDHDAIRVPAEKRPASGPELNLERRKMQRPGESKKFRLISDIQDYTFADLCVEVVKKWEGDFGCELYVTDYTENTLLLYYKNPSESKDDFGRDGDPYSYTNGFKAGWPGPWGHRVLKVVCKPPHADVANAKVEVGAHVRLTNTKIRLNNVNMLEGTLWPDQRYPGKIYITVLSRGDLVEVQDIVERKRQYYATQSHEVEPVRDSATHDTANRTKSALKRSKKKAKKAAKEAEALAVKEAELEMALAPNQHTRCSDGTIPLSSIATILDSSGERHKEVLPNGRSLILPFVNTNYRAKVQVLDFQPALEDFAVVTDELEDDSMDLSIESSQRWEWNFTLLLHDAKKEGSNPEDCILVNVGHPQAQFLLGNDMPDPANLREQSMLLNKLREKMYILWGNLEEQKAAGADDMPSNRPFECCLSEYGVLKSGGKPENIFDWERQYMLHGLTIL